MQHIALAKLRLSDENVRKTERDAEVESLAADIAARGLKQNLVVIPAPFREVDEELYEVVAGGRRLQALQLLDLTGQLPASIAENGVPCLIEEAEHAVETSLSENLHRVAMNPADEFTAFKIVIDQQRERGPDDMEKAISYCANRFGVTEAHVRGRLRLANLADCILDALRAKDISLASALAYGAVDDQDMQIEAFAAQTKSTWKPHDPDSIRAAYAKKAYTPQSSSVIYIGGIEPYEKRGGRVQRDLFTLDATQLLVDIKLVDDMVTEQFAKDKAKLVKRLGVDDAILASNAYTVKAPKGFQSKHIGMGYDETPAQIKERWAEFRKKNPGKVIAALYVDHQGQLSQCHYGLAEEPEVEEGAEVKPEREAYRPQTEEEREAERRERYVKLEMLRLAVPITAGTPFEGRLYLPGPLTWPRIREVEGRLMLDIEMAFSPDEIEQHREAAERAVDAAIAEHEAVAAAAKAALAKAEAMAEALDAYFMEHGAPDVVEDIDGDVFHRWESGIYSEQAPVEGDEEDENAGGYTSIEDLQACGVKIVQFWMNREDWVARPTQGDELPDAPAADSDTPDEDLEAA